MLTISFYNYVCIAAIIACGLILYASIYPGQPAHVFVWVKFWGLLLGLMLFPLIGWWIWQSRRWLWAPGGGPKWLAIVSPAMVGLTWGLVQFNIPQTVAFRLSQPAFEQSLSSVPDSVMQVDRKIGLYKVERYGTDPRGGIYFRVRWEDAPLDIIHYGFVYQPNEYGSPFGEINYTLQHLTDDWYLFSETSPFRL